MDEAIQDLTENICEIPEKIDTDASPDYKTPSLTTSGGWSIFAQNGKLMRLSAIKTFHDGITYFIHLSPTEGGGFSISDAGAEPALICSDGSIMFLHRLIMIPTKYCDIEINLV